MKADLFFKGITQSYTTGHHQGEPSDKSDINELIDENMPSNDEHENINRMLEGLFAYRENAETSKIGNESIEYEHLILMYKIIFAF